MEREPEDKIMVTVEQIQQAVDEKKYIISVLGPYKYLGIPREIGNNRLGDTVVVTEWEMSSDTIWVNTWANIENIERVITEKEFYNLIFEFTQVDHLYPTWSR